MGCVQQVLVVLFEVVVAISSNVLTYKGVTIRFHSFSSTFEIFNHRTNCIMVVHVNK